MYALTFYGSTLKFRCTVFFLCNDNKLILFYKAKMTEDISVTQTQIKLQDTCQKAAMGKQSQLLSCLEDFKLDKDIMSESLSFSFAKDTNHPTSF